MINFKNIIIFLFLLIIILPPFFSGGRNIFVNEIVSLIIYLIFLFFLFLPASEKVIDGNKTAYLLLSLFLLFLFLSVFFSVSPYRSLSEWLRYLDFFILFYLVTRLHFSERELKVLLNLFLLSATILCLIGLFFYLTGNYTRLTSTFYWPNPFAGYLLFVLPLSFYYFFKEERRILPIFLLSIIILSLILTGSRGAFLSFLVCFLIFIRYYFVNFKKRLPSALAAACLIVFFLIIFSFQKSGAFSYLARNYDSANHLDFSSKIKLNYWDGAVKIFKSLPIFGSGPDTFSLVYPSYQKDAVSSGRYPHNWILEMMAESGLLALIIFIVFLSYIFVKNRDTIKNNNLKTALFFSVLASFIHNFIDIDWHFSANAIIFWAFLGLIYNNSINQKPRIVINKKRNYFSLILLFILVSLLIFKSLILLYSKYNFQAGINYLNKKDLLSAEKYFKRSAFASLNPDYFRQYGIILYALSSQRGDDYLNKAEQIFKKLTEIDSHNSLNYELGGKIYAAQKNIDQAKINFKKAIELDKLNHPSFYYDLAVILIKEGRLKEAEDIINSILFYYPDEVVENKKMIILENQAKTSGIEKDISNIYYLLRFIKEQEIRKDI